MKKYCKLILFQLLFDGSYKFVIVRDNKGKYGFPMHLNRSGETDKGIANMIIKNVICINAEVENSISKTINRKNANNEKVDSNYWVAEFYTKKHRCHSKEIEEVLFVEYEDVLKLLTHKIDKEMFIEAAKKIMKKYAITCGFESAEE